MKNFLRIAALVSGLGLAFNVCADTSLLNVSYDVTRELYKDINPAFAKAWKAKSGEDVTVKQSHGGSSKQARAVADGLEADVVTMNQSNDVDILAGRGLIPADWQKRLPHASAPYTTTTIFLVRKGNPKKIKDWDDLARPGVAVIVPSPKTSGNGRYTYLGAWGYVLKKGGNEAKAREFVTRVFRNAPILPPGGRDATTAFIQREQGDVLVTFENEAQLIRDELGGDKFEVVYPSSSILAEPPVTVVDKVVDKHHTRKEALAYLDFLYSPEGQEIIARHHFRPRDPAVLKKHATEFRAIALFSLDDTFGGWKAAQKKHFDDGGLFDQIFEGKK